MLPFQSLNGASALGQGAVWDLDDTASEFTVQVSGEVTPDGSGDSWTVGIEVQGSLDGVTWQLLQLDGTFSSPNYAPSLQGGPSQMSGAVMACTPSAYSSGQSNPAVRYICLNISTASHLSSYSVNGWIAQGASIA